MFTGMLENAGINSRALDYSMQARRNLWNSNQQNRTGFGAFAQFQGFGSLDEMSQQALAAYRTKDTADDDVFKARAEGRKAQIDAELAGMKGEYSTNLMTPEAIAAAKAEGRLDAEGNMYSPDQMNERQKLLDETAALDMALSDAMKQLAATMELQATEIAAAARNGQLALEQAPLQGLNRGKSAERGVIAAFDNWQTALNDGDPRNDDAYEAEYRRAQKEQRMAEFDNLLAPTRSAAAQAQANADSRAAARYRAQLARAEKERLLLEAAATGQPVGAAEMGAAEDAIVLADSDTRKADRDYALKQYDLQAARGPQGAVNLAIVRQARARAQAALSVGDELVDAEIEIANAERALRQAQYARVQAILRTYQVGVKDSLRAADIGVLAANINVQDVAREFGTDSAEYYAALAQLGEAEKALRQAYAARVQALYNLKKSRTNDNLYDANLDVQAAKQILDAARAGGDIDEIIAAEQAYNDAVNAERAAYRARVQALFGLQRARTRDPLQKNDSDIAMLNQLMEDAKKANDIDAQIQIATQLVEAQKAQADAMQDVRSSAFELRQAELNAMEDYVGAAQVAAAQAAQQLQYGIDQGVGEAAINRLRAQAISADKAAQDAVYTDRYDEYRYMLEMNEISKSTYMAHIRNLQSTVIPGSKKFKELELELKRLKDDMSSDLSVNMPSSLGLPTVYEIRRMNQQTSYNNISGATGYNDNRTLNINGTMINNGMDFEQFVQVMAQFMGVSGTSGTAPRRY
jgi:hypothetical protein